MWKMIMCIIMISITSAKVSYDGYKVFKIIPKTSGQLLQLRELSIEKGFNYWQEPFDIDKEVHLMVEPRYFLLFNSIMKHYHFNFSITVDNVQNLIDLLIVQHESEIFDFTQYHQLAKIYDYLRYAEKKYPNNVNVVVGGKSYEKRDILGVKVSFCERNPTVFIEGGIYARDWISPATAMYILHQVLTNKDSNVQRVLKAYNWIFFPVLNPDGYEYTFTENRLWKKNRKPFSSVCVGTDLNRNWRFQWNTTNDISDPCSENYPGPFAFSETETKSLIKYIISIKDSIYAYISFHSSGQKLMFPFGYATTRIHNYEYMRKLGLKAIEALKKKYNTVYTTGSISEVMGKMSGSSIDYVTAIIEPPIVFVYELRDGPYKFLLPSNQIIPTGEETLDSLVVILNDTKLQYTNRIH